MATSPPERLLSLTQIIAAYWPVLVSSFLISMLATPLFRAFARKLQVVDRPDALLKPHKRPIPYLGGMAIFLGWAGGILLALVLFGSAEQPGRNSLISPSFSRAIHPDQSPNPTEGAVGDSFVT